MGFHINEKKAAKNTANSAKSTVQGGSSKFIAKANTKSTGANNGSLVNGPVLVGTGSSASLSFDGVNDNITVAHSSGTAPGNSLTFGVMFKSSSVSGTIVVMGKQK